MLIGLLTGHINWQYMLHKMRRAKTPSCRMLIGFLTGRINLHSAIHAAQDKNISPSCRRCGAEKKTSVHILCECRVVEKGRMLTLGFVRMNPEQIRGEAERDRGPVRGLDS